MSITEPSLAVGKAVTINVGTGSQIGVIPLHRGHHAVWASACYQADICNMVDDVVVRDLTTGLLYRFPIDQALLPWVETLVVAMDEYDEASGSPWACHNVGVRAALVDVAFKRLHGTPPQRNIFEPGLVAPAVVCDDGPRTVDDMLARIISERPDALVPES